MEDENEEAFAAIGELLRDVQVYLDGQPDKEAHRLAGKVEFVRTTWFDSADEDEDEDEEGDE